MDNSTKYHPDFKETKYLNTNIIYFVEFKCTVTVARH